MKRSILIAFIAVLVMSLFPAHAQTAFEYVNFPEPAENKFNIVGGALSSGRLIVWNGDAIFFQDGFKLDSFTQVADGYDGDPSFLALSPGRDRVLLGAGSSGEIFEFDPNDPRDFSSSRILTNRLHTGGAFLTDELFLIDAVVPNQTASELVVLDVGAKGGEGQTVVEKPDGSLPAQVVVDVPGAAIYAMDVTTRQVRVFGFGELIDAYDDDEVLDWETDGTLIGPPGQFYNGGISGLTEEGLLIIGGAFTSAGPGGVQLVDPLGGTIVRTFAPGGQNGIYRVVWNPISQIISARVNLQTFGIDLQVESPEGEGEGGLEGEGEGSGEGEGEGELSGEGEGELAVEGEGEGAGEGNAEGEGEGEGEAEVPSEGEGEFTGPCLLDSVSFAAPEDGSTIYVGSSVGSFTIPIQASTNCDEDTARVEFLLTEPSVTGGARFSRFATAFEAPYQATLFDSRLSTRGQRFLLTARAFSISGTAAVEETIGVTVVAPNSAADADANGLPDEPFETLTLSGDRWLTSAPLSSGLLQMVSSVTALYSAGAVKQDLEEELVVEIKSPVNTGQTVIVNVPRALVRSSERGIVVVQVAPELASLVGLSEAGIYGREPDGRFRGSGQYIHVSVAVTADDGETYAPVGDSRLNNNPIVVAIEGLPLDAGTDYTLAGHPSALSQTDDGAVLLATTDVWTTLDNQLITDATGRIEGTITELGVIAPFEIIDEDAFCVNGNCLPPLLGIEFFILIALGILQFVDGGVGGGSPCFIATAAYGTPLAAQIDVLRGVRDHALLESSLGTAFVDMYYHLSPPLADWIAVNPWAALLVRLLLLPVIIAAHLPGWVCALGFAGLIARKLRFRLRRSR